MTRRTRVFLAATAVGLGLAGAAYANFPRLNATEADIRNAIANLRAAPDMYAGHKAAAINLLERAYGELQAAKGSVR